MTSSAALGKGFGWNIRSTIRVTVV